MTKELTNEGATTLRNSASSWPLSVFAALEIVRARNDQSNQNHFDCVDIHSNGVIVDGDRYIWTVDRMGEEMVAWLTVEYDTFRNGSEKSRGYIPVSECTTPANVVAKFRDA